MNKLIKLKLLQFAHKKNALLQQTQVPAEKLQVSFGTYLRIWDVMVMTSSLVTFFLSVFIQIWH